MKTFCSRSAASVDRSETIQSLRENLCQFQQALRTEARQKNAVSTGIHPLDCILPGQGLKQGTLSEWVSMEAGSGATSLAMHVAGQAQSNGPLLIADRQQHFYAPAFSSVGVCSEKTILIRPKSRTDELWAVEQALRCPGIGAVICQPERLKTQEFRRLQLAAESGTAIGLLIRPAAAHRQSGWADVRLLISPQPTSRNSFCRRVDVRCVYAKGGLADQTVKLEICDETNAVRLAAGLSDSATLLSAAGT